MEPGKCQMGSPSLPHPSHDLDQVSAPLSLFPHLRKGTAEPNSWSEWQNQCSAGRGRCQWPKWQVELSCVLS